MRSTVRRTIDLSLGVAAAALLALLVAPWRVAPLPGGTGDGTPRPAARASELRASASDVPPETVLRLFSGGASLSAPAASSGRSAAAAVEAPWLRYMGRSSDPDGTTHVYVKDEKSGRVIRATRDRALNGWVLVEETEERLILANDDDERYAVSKR